MTRRHWHTRVVELAWNANGSDHAHAAAFSDDRSCTVIRSGRTARLIDVATDKPLGPPLNQEGNFDRVAIGADGGTVATGPFEPAKDTATITQDATARQRGIMTFND